MSKQCLTNTNSSSRLQELKTQIFLNTILLNPYIKQKPTQKQAEALLLDNREILYGGAAGPGKSSWLLMRALQYVMVPRYSAIIFRKSFTDLSKAGALIDRSHEWLDSTDAKWDGVNHIWTFPSNAKLSFGALENDRDVYHHQSAEYQLIGFDELTQFTEFQYRYMQSRLRRLGDEYVPLQMAAASNPGGVGHDWVKQRFLIEGLEHKRAFVPGKMKDNPHLDQPAYLESLNALDPITRQQLLDGDWNARHGGSIFKREWFSIVTQTPATAIKCRYWDKAATAPKQDNDPDYTVGARLAAFNGQIWIEDIKRIRAAPPQVEALIKQTAQTDGYSVPIYMEQEPGSSGVESIDHYAREVLFGYTFHGVKTTGPKAERASPVSSAAEAGNIKLLQATWNTELLDEFEGFPQGNHDDIVDAVSGAFSQLTKPATAPLPAWSFG